jgi:hypothetical protein
LRPSDATEERQRALRIELVKIEEELVRLSTAIASGGELAALLDAVRKREERRRRLQAEMMSLDGLVRVSALDLRRLERAIRERFDDWHGLMEREVDHARRALSAALVGRLVFTPRSEGDTRYYEFVGRWSIGRVVAGIVQAKGMVTPGGSHR